MIKLPGDEFVTIELVHDPDGPAISDGNRIELVQGPRGHAAGISAADWMD
jgi:hypothetical protein